ncbi:MAG: Holliday junction resolvase Hjc [Candidatus Bathyarchaeota archaeon]|nr:Holliday junction resolvase Hjc [Candidatus Bathyarchaeota archaeon]
MSLRDLALKAKGGLRGRKGRILTVKEIKRIRKRGYHAERELVRKLRALGFQSVRVPVSSPSKEPLPDVFAVRGKSLLAFEVKALNAERVYFKKDQVDKLFRFLEMFDAYEDRFAILAGKFPYRWVFKQVNEVADYVIKCDESSNIRLDRI